MIEALLMAIGGAVLLIAGIYAIAFGLLWALSWIESRGHTPRRLRVDDVTLERLRREGQDGGAP